MSKKMSIRIISYAICLSVVGFGFFLRERNENKKLRLNAENEYFSALNSLSESVNDITDTLNKTIYLKSGSDLSGLSTRLYAEGEIAKDSLAKISGETQNANNVNKFLSQVGNYALWLSKNASETEGIKKDENDMLVKLYNTSKKISNAVDETYVSYDNRDEFTDIIDNKIKGDTDYKTLATSLQNLEQDLTDYPTLIYDGPFSDHILTKEPLMIKDAEEKDKEYCKSRAENILNLEEGALKFDGEQNGKIAAYRFVNKNVTVCMTKKGGYLLYMRKNRDVTQNKISNKTAVNIAKEYIKGLDVTNMTESYYFADEGVCVINFAFRDGNVICYPDLLKIGVALDTGEIMMIETNGYLSNHTSRMLKAPKFSEDKARKNLSEGLTVQKTSIALIPTEGENEVMCYEFLCKTSLNQEVLVYINTDNLETENIFILEKSEAGTLVK